MVRINNTQRRESMICALVTNITGLNYCTVCGSMAEFKEYGSTPRPHALCPICGSLERHRLMNMVLDSSLSQNYCSMLYIGKEKKTAELCSNYGKVDHMFVTDGTSILSEIKSLGDKSFDSIVCDDLFAHINDQAHFLEAIKDRLKKGGILIIGGFKSNVSSPLDKNNFEYIANTINNFNDMSVEVLATDIKLRVNTSLGSNSITEEQQRTYSTRGNYVIYVVTT